jgi:hypothetical protein
MKHFDTTLRYYSFSVHFNPFVQYTEWDDVADKAQNYFVQFLNEKDYGDDVMPITFQFFVEKEIDLNKQHDNISTASYFGIQKNARLNLHFDYEYFINASSEIQFTMTINGILFLLQYWNSNLKVPKGMPLENIIVDYKNKLVKDNFFMEIFSEKYTKFTNQFRFNFMNNHFYGLKEKHILFDTNDIEKYLNNRLYQYDFGTSIKELYFSYDIFNFSKVGHQQYVDNEKEYGYGKRKDLIIMEQYDSALFYQKTKKEHLAYLHQGILNAIKRIEHMKRKPKDFNDKEFYQVIDKLLYEYEEQIKNNETLIR